MGHIMQSEMRAVLHLLLPRHGAIVAGASQHAHTIGPLDYFNP
jgi:hypothetical protein